MVSLLKNNLGAISTPLKLSPVRQRPSDEHKAVHYCTPLLPKLDQVSLSAPRATYQRHLVASVCLRLANHDFHFFSRVNVAHLKWYRVALKFARARLDCEPSQLTPRLELCISLL